MVVLQVTDFQLGPIYLPWFLQYAQILIEGHCTPLDWFLALVFQLFEQIGPICYLGLGWVGLGVAVLNWTEGLVVVLARFPSMMAMRTYASSSQGFNRVFLILPHPSPQQHPYPSVGSISPYNSFAPVLGFYASISIVGSAISDKVQLWKTIVNSPD